MGLCVHSGYSLIQGFKSFIETGLKSILISEFVLSLEALPVHLILCLVNIYILDSVLDGLNDTATTEAGRT